MSAMQRYALPVWKEPVTHRLSYLSFVKMRNCEGDDEPSLRFVLASGARRRNPVILIVVESNHEAGCLPAGVTHLYLHATLNLSPLYEYEGILNWTSGDMWLSAHDLYFHKDGRTGAVESRLKRCETSTAPAQLVTGYPINGFPLKQVFYQGYCVPEGSVRMVF